MTRRDRSTTFCLICLALCVLPSSAQEPTPPHDPRATVLHGQGQDLMAKHDYSAAIPLFQQAYAIDKTGHLSDAATDLDLLGQCCFSSQRYAEARDYYQQELPLVRQLNDKTGEADTLNSLGITEERLSHHAQALDVFQQALQLYRQQGYQGPVARALTEIGLAYEGLSQYDKALDSLKQALTIQKHWNDKVGEAVTLNFLGRSYMHLGQYANALGCFQQSLPTLHRSDDPATEAGLLNNLGSVYSSLSQYPKAFTFYRRALDIQRQTKDRSGEAVTLTNMGNTYTGITQFAKGMDSLQQALTLYRQIQNADGEAATLSLIGGIYSVQGQHARALDSLQQALRIYQRTGNRDGEGQTLNSLGETYEGLSRYSQAMEIFQQALTIHQQTGDQNAVADTTIAIGGIYDILEQQTTALDFCRQALAIYRQTGNRIGEASTLNNIGSLYERQGQYVKALDYFRQALPLIRRIGSKDSEANTLNDLGWVSLDLKQYAAALSLYQQALPLYRLANDRDGEASTFNAMGRAYGGLKQYDKAQSYFQQALVIRRQIDNKDGEGGTLSDLMTLWQKQHVSRLAIFYGKQAVNTIQGVRQNMRGLNKDLQTSYLNSVSDIYRSLADLLISEGRLPEAEQVLKMLKDRELSDVLRGPVVVPGVPGQVDLTPEEAAQEARYEQIADQLTAFGTQQQELLDKKKQAGGTLPAPDQQRLTDLTQKLAAANHHLSLFLSQLAAVFHTSTTTTQSLQTRLQSVKDATGLQDTLRRLHAQGQDVVVLETVVAPDRYAVIVTTANSRKVEQFAIKDTDLNKKVAALQDALRDPTVDPTGPAHDLYRIVFAPIEQDLAQAHAQTLMWSLDGSLRYIPVAALYDGQHYLVERFDNEVFTLGSQTGFGPDEAARWDALGLGVAQGHTVDAPAGGQPFQFPALPAVPAELHGVVQDAGHPNGALPGAVLLDDQFTQATMTDGLQTGRYNVVHVASHFAMLPATPDRSFLLLGDGHPLTLSAMADDTTLFAGVDLLVLSACETASGGKSGDGKEVDGLGSVAQQDGAKSVLASLWAVSDASTQHLMEAFYRWHETHAGASKSASLRQAQLSLLRGTAAPPIGAADAPGRGTALDNAPRNGDGLPSFTPDPKAPYAHPFYWAPFVLIGNWR